MTDTITEQALAWHEALGSDAADWDGFTLWLEADPRHRRAYDEIARIDDLVARNRAALAAILPADLPAPARRPWAIGSGIAAAAAVLLVPMLVLLRPEASVPPTWYATERAQTRQLALADGSRIALSASTRLGIGAKGREITLAGAASFDVPHRPDRVLTVHAGGVEISDIGTRFEVSTGRGFVRIAVAEGRLTARLADGQSIPVTAGTRLLVDTGRAVVETSALEPGAFAAWRSGRLVYQNAPLSLVAADVVRYAGSDIRMAPDVASRRFSGILTIGNGSGLVRNLAQIMDLDIRAEDKAVRLLPHASRRAGARPGS